MLFLEVSAKTGRNVGETFTSLTKQIMGSRAANGLEDEALNLKIATQKPASKCNC